MGYTPMMQHYLDTKGKYKDCILFYRLGDFYEMFFEDALTASKVMEVTLTGKNCGMEERAPMCGVPHHSVDTYIAKLVDKGYKVAICEQMEDPAEAKGMVRREVVRVVTPGTVTSQTMLSEKDNNYLACVYVAENCAGFSFCDISTGEIGCGEFKGNSFEDKLINELGQAVNCVGAENEIDIRITFFNTGGNLFLLNHTSAQGNYGLRTGLLYGFKGTNIAKHSVLRMTADCTGVKKYQIGVVGRIGKAKAHFGKHTLNTLAVTDILLTAVGMNKSNRSVTKPFHKQWRRFFAIFTLLCHFFGADYGYVASQTAHLRFKISISSIGFEISSLAPFSSSSSRPLKPQRTPTG